MRQAYLTSYVLAFGAIAAAVLLRYLLNPWMGEALPLVTLFGAVAAVVWVGRLPPGDSGSDRRVPRV